MRKKRIRKNVAGTKARPRLSVYRSGKHIYAQIINDEEGITLVSGSDAEFLKKLDKGAKKSTKVELAAMVGETLADKLLKKKIKKVVFDRGGYKYHGRVKSLAEGARKKGLEF